MALVLCSAGLLAGCGENGNFKLFNTKPGTEVTSGIDGPSTTKLVERDVEVPEVFQATDDGLWDGRPSLGGVWVAHPDVAEPERVIIRNEDNGKFVIGALFKRERENPGPVFQVSSDAAAALGILAGAPGRLNVTALRREEVPLSGELPLDPAAVDPDAETVEFDAPETIDTETLEDPVQLAAAALDSAVTVPTPEATPEPELTNVVPTAAPVATELPSTVTAVAPPARPTELPLDKPFIQIGLFSVEDNAVRNGNTLRDAGIIPAVVQEDSNGRIYWRVLAGPAPTEADRASLLAKLKSMGYADAYAVRN